MVWAEICGLPTLSGAIAGIASFILAEAVVRL